MVGDLNIPATNQLCLSNQLLFVIYKQFTVYKCLHTNIPRCFISHTCFFVFNNHFRKLINAEIKSCPFKESHQLTNNNIFNAYSEIMYNPHPRLPVCACVCVVTCGCLDECVKMCGVSMLLFFV